MESRTNEFFKAVKDGRLSQTDIYSGIESLTGGMNLERLLMLLEDFQFFMGWEIYLDMTRYLEKVNEGILPSKPEKVFFNDNHVLFYLLETLKHEIKTRNEDILKPEKQKSDDAAPSSARKPKVYSEDVQDVIGILARYFDEESYTDMASLLSGKAEPSKPLLFHGKWKQLGNAFGQLKKGDILQGFKNHHELIEWLLRNFRTNDSEAVEYDSMRGYVSADLNGYSKRILRIDSNTKKVTKP